MFYFPDSPTEISPDLLRKLDAEQPGKYIAQPKYDGWRRFAQHTGGRWIWRSKPGNARETMPLPDDLREEFEAHFWPQDITVDLEWVGSHRNNQKPGLYVFDLIRKDVPFIERYTRLGKLLDESERIHIVPAWSNPGLHDHFVAQLTTGGLTEGLVVRRADSHIIGHPSRCVTSPHVFKVKFSNSKELKR